MFLLQGCSTSTRRTGETTPTSSSATMSAVTLERLSASIFEVVVQSKPNLNVRYDPPISLAGKFGETGLKTKYQGIGTAFMIAPNRYVSAAHVIPGEMSSHESYFLQDESGRIFKICNVYRYSSPQLKDFIEFDISSKPIAQIQPNGNAKAARPHSPLKVQTHVSLAETVYTVGNAYGQGIAIRSGIVSAIRPIPELGNEKQIVYSAGTSPGNSGGPLLNSGGEVVGIVQKGIRSDTLNYALPISEFLNSNENEAYLYDTEVLDGAQMTGEKRAWSHTLRLPLAWESFSSKASKAFGKEILRRIKASGHNYDAQSYAKAPHLRSYLVNQNYSPRPILLTELRTGQWISYKVERVREFDVTGNQHLTVGFFAVEPKVMWFSLQLPQGVDGPPLLLNPKVLMDSYLAPGFIGQKFSDNGPEHKIRSLGEPNKRKHITDSLGRPWEFYSWQGPNLQMIYNMICTLTPSEIHCFVEDTTLAEQKLFHAERLKNLSRRLAFSYIGSIDHWNSWLKIHRKYKPDFLARSSLSKMENGGLRLKFNDYDLVINPGDFSQPRIGDDTGFEPNYPHKMAVHGITVLDRSRFVSLRRSDAPDVDSTVHFKKQWYLMVNSATPYDRHPIEINGKERALISVTTLPISAGRQPANQISKRYPESLYVLKCRTSGVNSKSEHMEFCDGILRRFNPDPHSRPK